MQLDPLLKFDNSDLPLRVAKKVRARMKYVEEGVGRVERATGLEYPPYYIEPVLTIATTEMEVGSLGVMYARTLPLEVKGILEICVELSAALIAFGLKTTIHAVIAHEFQHYVDLVRRFIKLDVVSDTSASTLYESTYADFEKLYSPLHLFQDRKLAKLVEKKFSNGLDDKRLLEKTVKDWVEKNLPAMTILPESNVLRVPMTLILNAQFDPLLKLKLQELERQEERAV